MQKLHATQKTQLTHKNINNIATTMAAVDALSTIFQHHPGPKI